MRFHLTYDGPLYGSNTGSPRAKHKQEIRKRLHRQLKLLWEHTWLARGQYGLWERGQSIDPKTPLVEAIASIYRRGNYRFVPLVREQFSLLCSLEVLFLRPDLPGSMIKSADIDNRLKTLFDALRMPDNENELGGYANPSEGEEPFFCLLEDDKLISHLSVATDMLLEPISGENSDARIIIDVKISPYNVTMFNTSFAGG